MIGIVLLWISAIFTIYTGWDYFRAGIHHLIEEDEAMKVKYFAWVRERVGKAEETIEPPAGCPHRRRPDRPGWRGAARLMPMPSRRRG